MSSTRHELTDGKVHIAFGKDHVFGYFMQAWMVKPNGEDYFLIDTDESMQDDLDREAIINIADNFGFDIKELI